MNIAATLYKSESLYRQACLIHLSSSLPYFHAYVWLRFKHTDLRTTVTLRTSTVNQDIKCLFNVLFPAEPDPRPQRPAVHQTAVRTENMAASLGNHVHNHSPLGELFPFKKLFWAFCYKLTFGWVTTLTKCSLGELPVM